MRTIIIAFISLIISYTSLAQDSKCDCNIVYDDLIQKLEENYLGLAQLRNASQDNEYKNWKIEFKNKVTNIQSENCTKVLQQFLSYFEDGHLFVFEFPKYSETEIAQSKRKIKAGITSIDDILQTLEYKKNMVEKNGLDGIIGKWTDGQSNIVIIKDEGYYKAYIINSNNSKSESGELKAIFTATDNGFDGTYYSYGYAPRYVEGNIYKEGTLLVLTGANYWGKLGDSAIREINMINEEEVNLPTIQKLDPQNTLFSIPSFMADYQKFNEILVDNLDLLKNSTNLIIDIRGNVGGNAIYLSLLNVYATQSMKSSQGLVLASEQTKIYFEKYAENSPEVYDPVIERIKAAIGQIVDGPKYPERIIEPIESNIENVAILTDNGCMSAAESFIIHSKRASTKVKTFGSPTGGVIDYTSTNSLKLNSGDQNIYFGYPTSSLHKEIPKNGYNKTGIIPDISIEDNIKDKVQFIINYYNRD